MMDLNEAIDQLAMANSVRWYGHVLKMEYGHVLKMENGHVLRALDFEVEGQSKGGRRGHGRSRLRKKVWFD